MARTTYDDLRDWLFDHGFKHTRQLTDDGDRFRVDVYTAPGGRQVMVSSMWGETARASGRDGLEWSCMGWDVLVPACDGNSIADTRANLLKWTERR